MTPTVTGKGDVAQSDGGESSGDLMGNSLYIGGRALVGTYYGSNLMVSRLNYLQNNLELRNSVNSLNIHSQVKFWKGVSSTSKIVGTSLNWIGLGTSALSMHQTGLGAENVLDFSYGLVAFGPWVG